jgi:MFS family permease
VKRYGNLLKTPGVARIIAAQLTARFPKGMIALAYLLHIEQIFNSYGAAGLVLAATSAGQAIGGPMTSRWMGRLGMRPVITGTLIISATAMAGVAFLVLPLWGYAVLGFIGGLLFPPIQPAVRTIYPKMVTSKQLTPLFSIDASAQEIIWVAGPVVTTFIAIQVSPQAAIMTAGAFLVLGGIWFLLSPEVGRVRIPPSKRAFGTVLKRPPIMLVTVVGFLLIGACAAVEVAVVATFGYDNLDAGFVLAIFALGSLIGGLALGHVQIGPWALTTRMAAVLLGLVLAAFIADFWWIAIMLLIAGAGIAPALAVMFAITSSSVKFSDTAEAYGWMGSGQLIGAAAGSAVAGFAIDGLGATGGFITAIAFGTVGLLVAVMFKSAHPDLRGKDASPIPDTEPVAIIRKDS